MYFVYLTVLATCQLLSAKTTKCLQLYLLSHRLVHIIYIAHYRVVTRFGKLIVSLLAPAQSLVQWAWGCRAAAPELLLRRMLVQLQT